MAKELEQLPGTLLGIAWLLLLLRRGLLLLADPLPLGTLALPLQQKGRQKSRQQLTGAQPDSIGCLRNTCIQNTPCQLLL